MLFWLLVLANSLCSLLQEFVADIALAPPTAQVDEQLMEQYRKEMEDAAALPLPGELSDEDL